MRSIRKLLETYNRNILSKFLIFQSKIHEPIWLEVLTYPDIQFVAAIHAFGT